MASHASITSLLLSLRASGPANSALYDQLYAALYDDLRRTAARLMKRERADHTLQPTALVHEAYFKLIDANQVDWQSRAHFLAVASRAMRQVLVDHARNRSAAKRGDGWERIPLDEIADASNGAWLQWLDLDRILHRLERVDVRAAQVAELRIIGGMKHEEIAEVLSVSVRTVAGDWSLSKKWLARELEREKDAGGRSKSSPSGRNESGSKEKPTEEE